MISRIIKDHNLGAQPMQIATGSPQNRYKLENVAIAMRCNIEAAQHGASCSLL